MSSRRAASAIRESLCFNDRPRESPPREAYVEGYYPLAPLLRPFSSRIPSSDLRSGGTRILGRLYNKIDQYRLAEAVNIASKTNAVKPATFPLNISRFQKSLSKIPSRSISAKKGTTNRTMNGIPVRTWARWYTFLV